VLRPVPEGGHVTDVEQLADLAVGQAFGERVRDCCLIRVNAELARGHGTSSLW
jgi:hypothetical protein